MIGPSVEQLTESARRHGLTSGEHRTVAFACEGIAAAYRAHGSRTFTAEQVAEHLDLFVQTLNEVARRLDLL